MPFCPIEDPRSGLIMLHQEDTRKEAALSPTMLVRCS